LFFHSPSPKVTIIIGGSSTTIPTLRETYKIDKVDVVFLDHWKDLYLADLKVGDMTESMLLFLCIFVCCTLFLSSFTYFYRSHFLRPLSSSFQLLESHDYLQRGHTVIVADNVLVPGAPDYLAYVTEAERSAPTTPSEQVSKEVSDGMGLEGGKVGSEFECASLLPYSALSLIFPLQPLACRFPSLYHTEPAHSSSDLLLQDGAARNHPRIYPAH